MTDHEKALVELTTNVAIIASSQKGCQELQTRTTKNIDKLTKGISDLVVDHAKMENKIDDIAKVRVDIGALQKNQRWGVITIIGIVIVAFMKFLIEYSTKGI